MEERIDLDHNDEYKERKDCIRLELEFEIIDAKLKDVMDVELIKGSEERIV